MIVSPQLSEEDVCKRNRRRERNRIAAQKCRNKKQVSADVLEEVSIALIDSYVLCYKFKSYL